MTPAEMANREQNRSRYGAQPKRANGLNVADPPFLPEWVPPVHRPSGRGRA